MGTLGRFACILTPMLLTLVSLICIIMIIVGGTNQNNAWISDTYFIGIDTRNIKVAGSTGGSALGLDDFYSIHLWNYCSGNITVDGGTETWTVSECQTPSSSFYFDIYQIFNVGSSGGIQESDIPEPVVKVTKAVKAISTTMIAMFCCAMAATVVTFVIGWFGLLSRWGSCVTTIFADVAFLFLLSAGSIATALYFTLREGFNKGLSFGAVAVTNKRTFTVLWIGIGLSFLACLFWMFSTCCCSGRSKRIMGDNNKSRNYEKAPYTYERAPPFAATSQGNAPGAQASTGYEPYRHAGSH